MVSSGTVGQTVVNVATIIDSAYRRAGIEVGKVTPDGIIATKLNLFLCLTSLTNEGINLWSVDKVVLGLNSKQESYDLPSGTMRIKTGLYRTVTLPSNGTVLQSEGDATNAFAQDVTLSYAQSTPNGWIGYLFANNTIIRNVGILPDGEQTLSLVWEASTDGATWVTLHTSPADTVYADNEWVYADIDGRILDCTYFRVRETGGGTLSVHSIVFASNPQEITMGQLNRDDYANLPFKGQTGGSRALQFWFDRQIEPKVWVWPAANNAFDQLVFWRTREIQDVGAMVNTLEIPNRWLDAVIADLAVRQYSELPHSLRDKTVLQELRDAAISSRMLAGGEETDGSDVNISVNISPYTA